MTAVALDSSTATVRTREAAIGNLFADAMRDGMHADAAMLNGGGIRAGKIYEPGARITPRRHPGRAAVQQSRGGGGDRRRASCRRAMENGLSALPRPSGRFPQVSGIAVEFDLAREPGSRVTAMQVGGAPLDDEQDLSRRGAGFSRARRRRLHHVPRRHAHHAGQRRADAGERGGRLSAQARHRAHRRRGTNCGEVTAAASARARRRPPRSRGEGTTTNTALVAHGAACAYRNSGATSGV